MGVPLPHPATGELHPSPVPAGTGWPGDPARPETPVATTAAGVRRLAAGARARGAGLGELDARVSVCRACPRLVRWREDVAVHKRASYADQPYWGRPIPGWGPADARILVVGLAPAAQGGNRTGRIFTGDRSGDWLFASLHRVGLATRATSVHAADGQALVDTRMVAAVRCAPPQNKPTTEERHTCAPWLDTELALLAGTVRVAVALGAIGWAAALTAFGAAGWKVPRPRPRFGHGAEALLRGSGEHGRHDVLLLGSYHPSQQNTFTGRLTEAMLDEVLGRAAEVAATMPR
ncbi:uracil-DNA glycosylase [Nocardioides ochotonae]|uniref:uracil-DNA glycosylase n=1 Tax=Nocardioides ochotonae TaxID=2685869 RepID=UPI00140984F0|nr:uracil-DNA glycosylase [Nocardioides ochotonae]